MSVVSTAAPVKTLLSPRRSDQSDGQSSEARDVLPSLPSSSSSTLMFLNAAAASSPTTGSSRRRRQRVPSLYGNSSAAVSDTKPIQGSSTYEYDVTSNLHRQQARRQRGDSNASISTVASYMSRSRSIADSFTSSIAAYERDGHVHGQFVSNTSGTGNDQASLRSGYGDSLYDGVAAASLRRLGVGNRNGLGPAKSSQGGSGTRSGARAAQPHLNDRLEILIANSASYRAAAAAAADRGQGQGRTPLAEIQPSINARHRKSSFASIRSLIGYSSSGAQRQSSTGAYETTTSTSRAASVFGIYMGGGGSRKGDNASKSSATLSSTLRVPTWAAQHAKPSAPTLTTINGEKLATVCRQGDAMGTLKGIRGLQVPSNLGVNQPSQGTKRQNVKELFALDTDSAAGNPNKKAEQGKRGVTSSPQSPTLSDGTAESSRHVSFHATLRKRAAQNNGGNGGGGGGGPSPTVVASSSRRAFAALDPTSSNHASGSATPRTVRSAKSPSSSRASSHVDLASLSALGANTPSPTLSAGFSSGADGTATSGAMPALDAALARAEDKSGLKTSSRCTACSKRVINAPVSRSGDVFCSRECRVETKQKRQQQVPPPVTEPSPATPSTMIANGLRSPTVAAPV